MVGVGVGEGTMGVEDGDGSDGFLNTNGFPFGITPLFPPMPGVVEVPGGAAVPALAALRAAIRSFNEVGLVDGGGGVDLVFSTIGVAVGRAGAGAGVGEGGDMVGTATGADAGESEGRSIIVASSFCMSSTSPTCSIIREIEAAGNTPSFPSSPLEPFNQSPSSSAKAFTFTVSPTLSENGWASVGGER